MANANERVSKAYNAWMHGMALPMGMTIFEARLHLDALRLAMGTSSVIGSPACVYSHTTGAQIRQIRKEASSFYIYGISSLFRSRLPTLSIEDSTPSQTIPPYAMLTKPVQSHSPGLSLKPFSATFLFSLSSRPFSSSPPGLISAQ